ncbi:DUF4350 domain-containing protein [Streptomyces sp. NPDC004726]
MNGVARSTTSMSPTGHQVWTRVRGPLLALVILIVAGLTMAALRSGDQHGSLDPRSADRLGSRAVAELLKDHGVPTRVVTTLAEASSAAGPDTTLLVATPDLLTDDQQRILRAATDSSGGRTVLVSPGPASVGILAPGVRTGSTATVSARAPRCSLPAARRAGDADLGGERYITDAPKADRCYPSDGLPTLVRTDAPGGGDTVLIGSADILHNHRLGKNGNASLALQLLGSRAHLVWYLPSLSDGSAAPDEGESFSELIPSGWLWGTLQLFIAAVLAAIWRARRLGPLVTERLPVAIRASESTEGRARLYHRTNARDRAAEALRAAARTRLAPLLGVAPADAHSPAVLLPSVTTHLPTTDQDLMALLFGPAPADDNALVHLADQLDALEREVRTS